MSLCLLKYQKPITKLPEKLIYLRDINTVMRPPQRQFVIFSPNDKEIGGLMHCHKSNLKMRQDYEGKSLAIDFIKTYTNDKGFGKALINFAKKYSKEIGCNGYVFLKAVHIFTPDRIPHLFYRKQGFTTLDAKLDSLMDKFIEKNKLATVKDFAPMLMYYPESQKEPKSTITEKLINFYQNIKNYYINRLN